MSWPQRPGAAPPAAPQRPPQGYNNQQNTYPNYQGAPPPAGTAPQQQQYWPAQPPQYNQQYGQAFQQQDYGNNANQFYQQPQYNQNYTNQGYANTQQQYPQNYYQNQGAQQQGYPAQQKTDSWEDNWDWGWGDDSAKQAQQAAAHKQAAAQAVQPPQQQVCNNANVIEESFASTDTWNWATEDKKDTKEPVPASNLEPFATQPEKPAENKTVTETPPPRSSSNSLTHAPAEEVRTLGDREVVKERLPNLALGKRLHLDNLTPQWSIESQMSQESSDGPQTHSEGTYRSDNQSRNSSKSSPGLNTENSNFNYSQSAIDEYTPSNDWPQQPNEDSTLVDKQGHNRGESHDELASSLQEMSIANRENPAPESAEANKELMNAPPPSISPANLPPPVSAFMGSSTLPNPMMPPAPPISQGAGPLPPPPTSLGLQPPPTSFSQASSSTNPFKQSGQFSHKKIASANPSLQSFPPTSGVNLISPNVVSKVSQSQHRLVGFGANLETTPDNSERPDQPQISAFRPAPSPQQVPDNMEVAPQNDRNEYLQTAHLSHGDYGDGGSFGRAPPPGLRRLVLGRQEAAPGDEPPPGLARMVPGQQEPAADYSQPADSYLDRHGDGQPGEPARPYRRADGRQTPEPYPQPRRPLGLDRMVPGEPSNDEYPQYGEQRVVTGLDRDYSRDAGPSDVREQNMDGSDYSEPTPRTHGAPGDVDEGQREGTMEGENLQDISAIAADGADTSPPAPARPASAERAPTGSRRHSLTRNTSGEDSERDRTFKASPRRDRDEHKSSRDHDRDRDKEGRYSRGDRKYDREREERRSTRDKDRGERDRDRRDESPHSRRQRRSTRSRRYDTEDTDYYSERERDRRSYREGSYASKPPRPEESGRRHERERERERARARRHGTAERERRPEDERRRRAGPARDERDRYEARYRDIDPSRKHGNLRAERDDDDRRRGELYSSPSRPDSREAVATDEDLNDAPGSASRRRERRARHARPERDPYYDSYAGGGGGGGGYTDPYELQRQQYQYYEQLRLSDPRAYLQVYQQLLAGRAPHLPHAKHAYPAVYGMGYEARTEDRGSVHSGRSSTNGLKGNDTYYSAALGAALRHDASSLRDAPSLRTDLSDRELNTTDASLNLLLEESTVRSERMTPFKFSTAHVKASISSRNIVVVRPSYPVDGLPATVHIMSLAAAAARDPMAQELASYPGPLVKGITHKKSVIEYCTGRARAAGRAAPRDVVGYVLVWELLALMLRQNGVVVGTDIAELLMKNTQEYELKVASTNNSTHNDSRRGSSLSGQEERAWSPDLPSACNNDLTPQEELSAASQAPPDQKAALDRLREHLTYGNRQEALEWAMSCGLWGHAMQLAGSMERRARAHVAARFLAAVPRTDPLHSLYALLQARTPPAATCVSDERWGDWRPHAAIMLSNSSARPEQDVRALTQLGDSLLSRGLLYSAQFCYVSAGVPVARHPLAPLPAPGAPPAAQAPPRLALLLADSRVNTLAALATNHAIFATEIYEYALSLNQEFVINELQVYKLILATRLIDVGLYERALGYVEAAARAVTRQPRSFGPALAARLAELAARLQPHDPALLADPPLLDEAGDSGEPSPRHARWLDDVTNVAHMLATEAASAHSTPQHAFYSAPAAPAAQAWGDQQAVQQQYQQPEPAPQPPPLQSYPSQEEPPDYSQYYQQPASLPEAPQQQQQQQEPTPNFTEEWGRQEEHPPQQQSYDSSYWQGDGLYSYGEVSQGEVGGAAGADAPRPTITMPGAARPQNNAYGDYDDDRAPSPHQQQGENEPQPSKLNTGKKPGKKEEGAGAGGGWLGGILTKLSLRAPNQMILPDDKNPSIVWDADNKRWRNLDAGEEEPAGAPPPPPKTQDLAPQMQSPGGVPPPHSAAPVSNIFKMQKGRHIKKSYVDVFNPSGAATRPLPPAADVLGPPPPAPAAGPPAYFIPAPHNHQVPLSVSINNMGAGHAAPSPAHPRPLYSQPLTLSIPSTPGDTPSGSPLPSPMTVYSEDEDLPRLQSGI